MPRRIDLSTLSSTQGFVIQGDAAYDHAGTSVAAAGDVNGDGFDDVIVGALGDDGGYNAGEAYVLFGGAGGFGRAVGGRQVVDLTLSGAQGFIIQGDTADDVAGRSVSAAGDVDGDGFADVIVGASGSLPTYAGFAHGEAYVLFGGVGGFGAPDGAGRQVIDLATLSPDQGFLMRGAPYDNAGGSVSDLGDINGDGFDDLIVGARGNFSVGYRPDEGRAYVLFGGADGFGTPDVAGRHVVDLTATAAADGFVIEGASSFGGPSVSAAGDVNGDGFEDIIIGAPSDYYGAAYVVFGGADGFGRPDSAGRQVLRVHSLSAEEGFRIQGGPFEHAGWSVSTAGDVNGDGFDDVVVGARLGDGGGNYAGEAYVLFGGAGGFGQAVGGRQVVDLTTLSGAQGFVIQGDAAFDEAGWSVSAAGDVNGDGFGDVIVGAPRGDDGGSEAGEAYVLFGGAGGFGTAVGGRQVVDLTTLTAAQGFVIQGDAEFDSAGISVSAAGDVNGDGFDDLIVGAPFGDDGGNYAGEAYVVFGGNFTGAVDAVGSAGDDVINSGPTGQTIFGAQGDDTLFGNKGADSLNGGFGDDSLNGGADDDTLAGGSGNDSAVGGGGDDRALGGDGKDSLSGRAGGDRLFGEAGKDSLAGNAGDDYLDGGESNDLLNGGAGNDTLIGGARGDVLIGGAGADLLTGGSGGDRFVFAAGASAVGAGDTITDFRGGFDTVVIQTATDSGSFLGGAAFTGAGGVEARFDTSLQQLQIDLNGNGTLGAGDLAIDGTTLATLGAFDLLFV